MGVTGRVTKGRQQELHFCSKLSQEWLFTKLLWHLKPHQGLSISISLSGQYDWPTVRGSPCQQWCHPVGSCQATILCAVEAAPDTWPGLVSGHLVGPQFCPKSPLLVWAQPPRGDSPTPPPLEPGTEIVTQLTLGSGRGNISGLHSVPKNTQCVLMSLPLPYSL